MPKQEKLFEQFPPVSTKEWMDKISADLKGADFTEKLVWKTNEGFEVKPFYRSEDTAGLKYISGLPGEFPYLRGTRKAGNSWMVRQDIDVKDYTLSNNKALDILMKGVDSIGFVINDPESVTEENIEILLKGIHLESVEINFIPNGKAREILTYFLKVAKKSGADIKKIRGGIETSPLGKLMINGKLCISVESGLDYLTSLAVEASVMPDFRTISVNASDFSNAGADIVKELAFGLSMGNEYISQLTERGLSADLAASKICFSFGTGSNYFFEIARLRAARLLWSIIVSAYKPEKKESSLMQIHCITSRWNKTVYDPFVNMLRTQTEAMSAVLGGTDSLTVEPFDVVFREPDEFSERIARNQQLLLKEEAYFDKTADPAGGSWYIEKLTLLIAEHTWKLFVEIEEKGGFLAALTTGFIQNSLADSALKRKDNIANGKEVLLGTNRFPDMNERAPSEIDTERIFKSMERESDLLIEPVRLFRGSEEYEKKRIESDKGAIKG
jgi:methylmalonyl-CoA mutase